jgi:hypothetical protein
MSLVTQRISFNGGVSQQPDTLKLPNQVKEAINCYPDVTFGTIKRSGSQFIAELEMEGGDDCPYILDLRMTGANGSSTFVDSSSYNHTITAVGDAQIQGNELLLDGEGSHLITAPNEVFTLGTSDFRIEGEITYDSFPEGSVYMYLFSIASESPSSFDPVMFISSYNGYFDCNFQWFYSEGGGPVWTSFAEPGAFVNPNEKTHFALIREGSSLFLEVNGTRLSDQGIPSWADSLIGDRVRIGYYFEWYTGEDGPSFKGKIDNFKICKPEPSS